MADFRAPVPLVLLAQAGDRKALEQLLIGIQAALFHYLKSLVRDPNLAEDILQDVYVLIWRKLRWLREPEMFRPWAYRIASREAEVKELDGAMAAPGFYENHEASRTVIDRHQALMWEVGDLMSQWEALQEHAADAAPES